MTIRYRLPTLSSRRQQANSAQRQLPRLSFFLMFSISCFFGLANGQLRKHDPFFSPVDTGLGMVVGLLVALSYDLIAMGINNNQNQSAPESQAFQISSSSR